MKKEFDDLLCSKYPKIFMDRHADMQTTAMCWGFECGDGWFALLDALCSRLQWDADNNNLPQIVAAQVKEKYGGLRFYTESSTDYQDGCIGMAEQMSEYICDVCGNPGKVGGVSWLAARCPEHTKEV